MRSLEVEGLLRSLWMRGKQLGWSPKRLWWFYRRTTMASRRVWKRGGFTIRYVEHEGVAHLQVFAVLPGYKVEQHVFCKCRRLDDAGEEES